MPLILVSLMSANAVACDDKACEVAYLTSTQQYVANYERQAITERTEREAHAKNRERRDFAVVKHLQRIQKYLSRQ